MNSKQLKVGNLSENNIAEFFQKHGYWAYVLPKKIGGQPFDIIACKNNTVWFIDAKHLRKEELSFPFDRIEPNQRSSMQYAKYFAGITNLGFVIDWERTDNGLFFLPYEQVIEIEQKGLKSVKITELKRMEEKL